MNPGSQMMTVTLSRDGPHQPWGFRLQGGSDFNTPLSLQMVNPGSVAERFGMQAQDAVLKINDMSSDELSHDQAKEVIMRSGNQVTMIIQRGATTFWKPQVTQMQNIRPEQINLDPTHGEEVYVQKTSLAANKQPAMNIGSSHNRAPKGFPGAFGGSSPAYQPAPMNRPEAPMYQQQSPAQQPFVIQQGTADNKAVVHSQYNSPMGLYSQNNVAQTYTDQASVLTSGMQGQGGGQQGAPPMGQQSAGGGGAPMAGFKSVSAPINKPPSEKPKQQLNQCASCGSLIMGVFIKIAGMPLHAECFKCVKCGVNLKQRGYFNIEDKLYCEDHAKQVAQRPNDNCNWIPTPVFK